MKFHLEKCKVLHIGTNRRNTKEYNYTLHDHTLEAVESGKYLGVTLTNNLSWKNNVEAVCTAAHLSPLTSEVVGVPQMTLQQYRSTPVFRCPKGISKPHYRPFLDVISPSLLLSSSPSCSFHCPLQNCLRHSRGS